MIVASNCLQSLVLEKLRRLCHKIKINIHIADKEDKTAGFCMKVLTIVNVRTYNRRPTKTDRAGVVSGFSTE